MSTIPTGYVWGGLMILVSVSFHLGEVSKASATDVAFDLKIVTMFALMLLEVPDVCSTVFTLITLVHHS